HRPLRRLTIAFRLNSRPRHGRRSCECSPYEKHNLARLTVAWEFACADRLGHTLSTLSSIPRSHRRPGGPGRALRLERRGIGLRVSRITLTDRLLPTHELRVPVAEADVAAGVFVDRAGVIRAGGLLELQFMP